MTSNLHHKSSSVENGAYHTSPHATVQGDDVNDEDRLNTYVDGPQKSEHIATSDPLDQLRSLIERFKLNAHQYAQQIREQEFELKWKARKIVELKQSLKNCPDDARSTLEGQIDYAKSAWRSLKSSLDSQYKSLDILLEELEQHEESLDVLENTWDVNSTTSILSTSQTESTEKQREILTEQPARTNVVEVRKQGVVNGLYRGQRIQQTVYTGYVRNSSNSDMYVSAYLPETGIQAPLGEQCGDELAIAQTNPSTELTQRTESTSNVSSTTEALATSSWSDSLTTVLDRPPSNLPKRLIGAGAIFLTIIGAWSYFGTIQEVGTARGKLVPEGRVYKIQASNAGAVKHINVNEGDEVTQGQVLFELDSRIANAEVERLEKEIVSLKEQFERTNIMRETARKESESLLQIAFAEIRIQESSIQQNQADIEAKQNLLASIRDEKAAHSQRLTNIRPLVEEGALAEDRLFELEQSVRERERSELETQASLQISLVEMEELEAELERRKESAQKSRLESQNRLQSLQVELTQIQSRINETESLLKSARANLDNRYLTSPINGAISKLSVDNIGEFAPEGSTLAEISPEGSSLVLQSLIGNAEAGFITRDMPAQLKFDAYPYQDFGVVSGVVNSVSPDTVTHEKEGEVYRLEIELDNTTISNGIDTIELKAGQTATAEIIIRKRRIVEILFDPIRKLGSGGLNM